MRRAITMTVVGLLAVAAAAAAADEPELRAMFAIDPIESTATFGSYWTGVDAIPTACTLLLTVEGGSVRVVPVRTPASAEDGLCARLPALAGSVVPGETGELGLASAPPPCFIQDQSEWSGRLVLSGAGGSPTRLEIEGWTGMACVADGYVLNYRLVGEPITVPRPPQAVE